MILLSLADRADDDGFCWPSIDDVARRCKVDRRSVSRLIKKIQHDKELYIHERIGNTHQYLVLPGMDLHEIIEAKKKRFDIPVDEVLDWLRGGDDKLSPLTGFTWGDDGIYMGGMTGFTPEPSLTQNNPQDSTPEKILGSEIMNRGKTGKPKPKPPKTKEEYQTRIIAAIDGFEDNANTVTSEVRQLFGVDISKPTNTHTDFIEWVGARRREGHTLQAFSAYWFNEDWRGKERQPPTLHQIQTEWPKAFGWEAPHDEQEIDKHMEVWT